MSIRAVDIVTITPRLQEAGRLQHQNQVQNLAGYQFQTALKQAEAEKAQSQVAETPSSREAAIQKDLGRRRGSGGGPLGGQRGRTGREGAKEEPGGDSVGHRLDIKV
mgnify:FL=1